MAWLSSLDQDIALQAGEGVETSDVSLVADTSLYDLPSGGDWDSITGLWVNGVKVPKLSGMAYGRIGVSRYGDQMLVYPTPTEAGTLRIAQQTVRAAYTNKTTDDLFLSAPFDSAYQWYVAAQMYLMDRDMDSHNNMVLKFNSVIEGFWVRKAQTGTSDGLVVSGIW